MITYKELLEGKNYEEILDDMMEDDPDDLLYAGEYYEIDDDILQKYNYKKWRKFAFDKTETVDVNKLIVTQDEVHKDIILKILNKFNINKVKIQALRYKNKLYVVNGHHSLMALYVKKIKKVKVNIEDVK